VITLFKSDQIYQLNDIKDQVRKQIRQLQKNVAFIGEPKQILRYEFSTKPVDCLAWLHNQTAATKIYWSDRNGDFEMAGIHSADQMTSLGQPDYQQLFDNMEDNLTADNPRLRYYGGMSFSYHRPDDIWKNFGTYTFIVPQFEFYQKQEETLFAFNVAIKDISENFINDMLERLEQINFQESTQYRKVPVICVREDLPNKEDLQNVFNTIQSERDTVQKVVLARKTNFKFDVSIRPSALIKHLKDKTPNCFHFCFQIAEHCGFIGASPERLYSKNQNKIHSEAIAGTMIRSEDAQKDQSLANDLLDSTKNALEHKYVVDYIQTALSKICEDVRADKDYSVLKLKEAHHLITRFEGHLKSNIDDSAILQSLHPTPAVAGKPTKNAIEIINKHEPFDRGWYAGPVGYFGYNESEFAVAIRCGLIQENILSLFAGAGIVEGSQFEEEWNEIESKISRFMKVFSNET